VSNRQRAGVLKKFWSTEGAGWKGIKSDPTDAKGRFEALFRFDGPDKPPFDHMWVLPDLEKVKIQT
jgi:hypothetical protein